MILGSFTSLVRRAVAPARQMGCALVEAAMPAPCPGCEGPLGEHRAGVCRACWREALAGADAPAGPRGGLQGKYPGTLTTLGPYEGRLRRIIRCLKFGEMYGLGDPLGEALARRLGDADRGIDIVIPVPLHWRRRLRRGYNQAEMIARGLARGIGVPLAPAALRRTRATRPQTGGSRRERAENVRGAFEAARGRLAGADVLLVDDVVTTGATIGECVRALRAAGVCCVHAAAPARTMASIH